MNDEAGNENPRDSAKYMVREKEPKGVLNEKVREENMEHTVKEKVREQEKEETANDTLRKHEPQDTGNAQFFGPITWYDDQGQKVCQFKRKLKEQNGLGIMGLTPWRNQLPSKRTMNDEAGNENPRGSAKDMVRKTESKGVLNEKVREEN